MIFTELRALKKERRLTKEERDRYITLWKSTGLSKSAFCKQEELAFSTFSSWLASMASPKESGGFAPLICNLSKPSILPEPEKQLKILMPNGTMIEGCFKREELALWLKEVKNGFSSLY